MLYSTILYNFNMCSDTSRFSVVCGAHDILNPDSNWQMSVAADIRMVSTSTGRLADDYISWQTGRCLTDRKNFHQQILTIRVGRKAGRLPVSLEGSTSTGTLPNNLASRQTSRQIVSQTGEVFNGRFQ